MSTTGLYIHIPYCHSKCAYCDFYSSPKRDDIERLVDSLIIEIDRRRYEVDADGRFATLYLGGGTPSILTIPQLSRLVESIGCHQWEEATIECNPEDVTPEWIDAVKSLGFTRVSMGIQSFDDEQLRTIGRRHTSAEAIGRAEMLTASGLDTSFDLIYGLPNQTLESWEHNVDRMIQLRPTHISAYLLSYEQGTRLWAMLQAGKVEEAPDELVFAMYKELCERTREAGYVHYEVSNFSLPGHQAVHNSRYWASKPYIGIGPSAHSFDGKTRRINPSSIREYINLVEQRGTVYDIEPESQIDLLNDVIITRLRTAQGLDIERLESQFGQEYTHRVLVEASPMIADGRLIKQGSRLCIPEPLWLTSDAIMRQLIVVD